jgi:hypothetical protein
LELSAQFIEGFKGDNMADGMLLKLLATIKDDGNSYFLMTDYNQYNAENDTEFPTDVFVMQEVEVDGDKRLEPLEDRALMEKIFDRFKS